MSNKNISYEDFVDKFKRKRTTDDCYTPPAIYDAVLRWAKGNLEIGNRPVVRPFYPGGDYEHYDYPEDGVVIDNPPFSIFAKIINFYVEHNIKFLLFAPAMSSIRDNCTYIGASSTITYENGAEVNTSFVTNMMGDLICTTAPNLYEAVKEANNANLKQKKKTFKKLSFPDSVLRATTLHTMSRAGVVFKVKKEDGQVVHKACKCKSEFGSSILLSDTATAERLTAERLAAKRLAAEKLELSDKSKTIIAELNSPY